MKHFPDSLSAIRFKIVMTLPESKFRGEHYLWFDAAEPIPFDTIINHLNDQIEIFRENGYSNFQIFSL